MRICAGSWIAGVAIGLLCLSAAPAGATTEASSAAPGGSDGSSTLGGPSSSSLVSLSAEPLVIAGSPEEAAQKQAGGEARRSDPGLAVEREASQTSFEGLSPEQKAAEAKTALPALVDHPNSTLQLPAGASIQRYVTDNSAQVSLPGALGLVESSSPLALQTPSGGHVPLDLTLRQNGGGFEPTRSAVEVQLPKDLTQGVALAGPGVSLTPVDSAGAPLGAAPGAVDGATVFWSIREDPASGVLDLGAMAKPTSDGVDLSALLFSKRSPSTLYFRIGMPAGAHLEQDAAGLRIVKEGATLAAIPTPAAKDAEGVTVPTSMSLHGDLIAVALTLRDYRDPIALDPEITDSQLATTTTGKASNWEFKTTNGSFFAGSKVYEGAGKEHLETKGIAEYKENEFAIWAYETKGNSKIYELKAETEAHNKSAKIESFLEFLAPGAVRETKDTLSTELTNVEYGRRALEPPLCGLNGEGKQSCLPGSGKEKNAVYFEQSATKAPGSGYKFSDTMYQGLVSISEPTGTHSTTGFNTASPELEFEVENESKKERVKRANALYGSGSWLSKFGGALEFIAKDPGIGVSATKLEYENAGKWEQLSAHNYLENENGCRGVQCYAEHKETWTLDPKLPNGEDKIRYRAEEAMAGTQSTESEGQATVKVDTAPPHRIVLHGLPFGNELSERPYELTAEATDGEGTTVASSGIKSIALFVDGREFGHASGSCSVPKGECTASAKWTINGAELGAGHHAIVIEARDNADNEARHYETLSIRHSTPVPLGPGSVDLQSGDFALGATDVSMGSGLTLSRNYSSRATEAGAEGPLGPQWSLSMASTESLVEMVDGSILMTAANGSQTIFAKTETTTYESPPGDSNLTLKLEENKETKQKLAYYLENAAAHTKVKFTLPTGDAKVWVPTRQEGTVATDTVTYTYQAAEQHNQYPLPSGSEPVAIAAGSGGDLWFTDSATSKIGKITTAGVITEYSLPSGSRPAAITEGPDGNEWFANHSTSKIGKITTSGAITEYSLPAKSEPTAITPGPDGDLWFTDKGTSKVGKITTAGYVTEYNVRGTPQAITAGPDGNLWFTECTGGETCGDVIGTITTTGTVVKEAEVGSGGELEQIVVGPDGNLWFTEYRHRIGKITTSGSVTTYNVPEEKIPHGITAGPDGNLWFTATEHEGRPGSSIGKITPSGAITEYSLASGSYPYGVTKGPDGNLWYTGASASTINMMTPSGTMTEPIEALAPVPPNVSCTPMKEGCRALKFKYATETTAKGENRSEWGQYKGRLSQVLLDAYNPSTKKMEEPAVAEYSYDKLGRLRAEWDPRISPALKTTYGYDEEGHVTALTRPGEESWAFTYGTASGDAGTGRLLKATQAPSSTPLWSGQLPTETEAPKISGSDVVGLRLAVSNGKWSSEPTAYGYQWEDCNAQGIGGCKAILGADNANYTVAWSDVGHRLAVKVSATNGGGTTTVTAVMPAEPPTYVNTLNVHEPAGIAVDGKGNLWVVNSTGDEVEEYNTSRVLILKFGSAGSGNGQFNSPDGIGLDSKGNVWVSDITNARIEEFNEKGEYVRKTGSLGTGNGQFKVPNGIAVDSKNNVWVADKANNRIEEFNEEGVFIRAVGSAGTGNGQFKEPAGLAVDSKNNVWVTDWFNNRVQEFNETGQYLSQFGTKGSGEGQFEYPNGITIDWQGYIWVADYGNGRVEEFNPSGEYETTFGSKGEYENVGPEQFLGPGSLARGPDGKIWIHGSEGRIDEWTTAKTEGSQGAPQPGTTIDYNVPVEGSSAPYQMGENPTTHKPETEKWGQKEDVPVEATAVVAPDSPQGWPASSYKRATLYYMDGQGRVVNLATPSTAAEGAISTSEYNEYNDVIRTLSPDNRLTALAAGEKSVEVAKLLDTENTYNGEGAREKEVSEQGTRLIETLGPQHEVKYMEGKEQKESLARNHMEYFYDQGVPKEEPYEKERYDLVTETSDLAQLANREEREVRTTKTSYSGQNNLGWKLRAPTSVTVDPNGLKLTTTTLYNETTGQVVETRGSAAESTLTYASKFGSAGSEAGKLKGPWGIAVDASGNLWVADSANNRLEKFGPEGKYLATVGEAGSEPGKLNNPEGVAIDSKGNLWVADSGNNRIEEFGPEGKYLAVVGSAGTGNGQMKAPAAPAFDSKGNLWVADTANNRIQEFNTEDKYVAQFGSAGSEPGKLSEPRGIAIDGEGHIWVADTNNNRIQEFSTTGTLLKHFAMLGAGEGQLSSPAGLAFDTGGNVWVADRLNNRVEAFSPSGGYITQIGSKGAESGQLVEPRALAFDAHGNAWVTDSANNRVQEFSKGANAQDAKTIYYSSEANTEGYTACGGHPEWSGLVCETLPAKQPELVAALPKLPVTTVVGYNIWNEPEKTEEVFGSGAGAKTRTKIETYDEAGRRASSETTSTSTEDAGLPKVSFEYNKETGVLQKQSATVEGKEQSIVSEYNRLGQLVKYTDADGNVAKYKYAGPEGDGLLEEVTDSSNEGKSYQAYTYDETTKLMNKLVDSAAGTFTASYDPEGRLLSETYPNSMCANYGYNSVGEATSIKYVKTTKCEEPEAPVWYSESRVPSVRGETYSQTSTLASNAYAYDAAGRLTETQETPTGQGCTTRAYAYDEAGNRASLATIKPGSKGECQSEGGTVEAHNYDEAGRMTDAEIAYDPLGNITKLPAADSEGRELISTFYVDNAVASQEETEKNSKTIEQKNVYSLDPEGRVRKTVATGKVVGTTISHYDGQGDAVAWTSEEGGKWTRNIPGIGGVLCATQTNGGTPELQLHDLHGNIVATAALSPSETKLLSTYNSTEFGVPNGKEPPKFAWLGAGDVSKSLSSGVITYGATSYVPQTGRALQSEQVEPPGLPGGSGAGAPYTSQEEPWVMQGAARAAAESPGLEAGREREAAIAAFAACAGSSACDPAVVSYFDAEEVAVMCGIVDAEDVAAVPLRVIELAGIKLSDIEKILFWEVVKEVTGLHSPFEWADEIDSQLHACLKVMVSGRGGNLNYARCEISLPMTEIWFTDLPDLFSMPSADYCLSYKQHCGRYGSKSQAFWFPSGKWL